MLSKKITEIEETCSFFNSIFLNKWDDIALVPQSAECTLMAGGAGLWPLLAWDTRDTGLEHDLPRLGVLPMFKVSDQKKK